MSKVKDLVEDDWSRRAHNQCPALPGKGFGCENG